MEKSANVFDCWPHRNSLSHHPSTLVVNIGIYIWADVAYQCADHLNRSAQQHVILFGNPSNSHDGVIVFLDQCFDQRLIVTGKHGDDLVELMGVFQVQFLGDGFLNDFP